MKRLYVRTEDFRLAHRLLSELHERNLTAKQLSLADAIEPDAYWFGTAEEVERLGGRGIPVEPESVKEAISAWLLSLQIDGPPSKLVIGIDPGPRPGYAFLSDGALLGKREMDSIGGAVQDISAVVKQTTPREVLVRIGHGSPVHRDRLINEILALGYHVEIVNEHRTSAGQSRHAHGSSAVKIAMVAGKPVHEQRRVDASHGELRNLQRISRQQSKGHITISLQTARRIAQGVLTMEEALKEAGYDSS